jgi:(2Fe-2S) ferredoxin
MPKPTRHVLVCLNQRPPENPKGSCAAKGSEEVLARLKDLVAERGLKQSVIVNGTRCLKHCSRGVTVAVYPENVWYASVTPEDAAEICDAHLVRGEPLERLFMPDIPWE